MSVVPVVSTTVTSLNRALSNTARKSASTMGVIASGLPVDSPTSGPRQRRKSASLQVYRTRVGRRLIPRVSCGRWQIRLTGESQLGGEASDVDGEDRHSQASVRRVMLRARRESVGAGLAISGTVNCWLRAGRFRQRHRRLQSGRPGRGCARRAVACISVGMAHCAASLPCTTAALHKRRRPPSADLRSSAIRGSAGLGRRGIAASAAASGGRRMTSALARSPSVIAPARPPRAVCSASLSRAPDQRRGLRVQPTRFSDKGQPIGQLDARRRLRWPTRRGGAKATPAGVVANIPPRQCGRDTRI